MYADYKEYYAWYNNNAIGSSERSEEANEHHLANDGLSDVGTVYNIGDTPAVRHNALLTVKESPI